MSSNYPPVSNTNYYSFTTEGEPVAFASNVMTVLTTQTGFSFSKMPVGDIVITDENNHYYYDPQKDITNYELAMLIRLFTMAGSTSTSFSMARNYDFWGFVCEKQLERHFKLKK